MSNAGRWPKKKEAGKVSNTYSKHTTAFGLREKKDTKDGT